MGAEYLVHFAMHIRSADRTNLSEAAVTLHQWSPSPITIEFDAVASDNDALLHIDLDAITPAPEIGAKWHSEAFELSTDWEHYSITLQEQDGLEDLDALVSFFLRVGLVESTPGDDAEAWVDNIRITDELNHDSVYNCAVQGPAPNGTTPADLAIDEDGIVTLDGEAFLPQILWFTDYPRDSEGRLDWLALDGLFEEASGAGFNAIFLEFSPTVHAYNTKRELWRIMRLAGCHDLFVVPRVASYPSAGIDTIQWPVHRGHAVEWLTELNDHPALLAWIAGDELSITDYGHGDDPPMSGRIDNHRLLKWARYSENPVNGGSGFYRPVLGVTAEGPFGANGLQIWNGYESPWLVMSRLATAVDIIVPNIFVKRGDSASKLYQTISRATDIVRNSQLICEDDDVKCPGLLKDPGPNDCEDSSVPGYCWQNKAVWPMIQLGPNKQDTRNIRSNELEIMGVQALMHGASGFIYAKSKDALATAGLNGCRLDCSGWQANPLCDGVEEAKLGDHTPKCPQWRLLDETYRNCWGTLPGLDGCGDALPLIHQLWAELPLIFDRLSMLQEELIGGLPATGTTRQWWINSKTEAESKVAATYVSAAEANEPKADREHLLWGDYTLWIDDETVDTGDIVARGLIRFDLTGMAQSSPPIYKAELTLPINNRTCDGTELTEGFAEDDSEEGCHFYQSEQVVVARVPEGVSWNEVVPPTWNTFQALWQGATDLPDVEVPFQMVSSFFHPLRHNRSPVPQVDPQLIVLDVTDIVSEWLHPTDPRTNNGFIVTQYDGHWGYPVGVVSNSEDFGEDWNPRIFPNLRLYRKAGEPIVRPLPVALEANNERVEMRMLKQTCPFGYAHVLLSHDDVVEAGAYPCLEPRLRVVLPQSPGNQKPQLWSLDGVKIMNLSFDDADECDQSWGEGERGPCNADCVDDPDEPHVYRIDVPLVPMGYLAAIVAIPRLGL